MVIYLPLDLNFWGLLGEVVPNGRICMFLAKHLKTVLGTRKNHRNLNRIFGDGVDNHGIVHSKIFLDPA